MKICEKTSVSETKKIRRNNVKMDHGPEPSIDVEKVMRVTLLKGKDVSSKQQEIQLHFSMCNRGNRMYINPFP